MIKNRTPLAMYEVKEIIKNTKETEKSKEIESMIKKFSKIDSKNAEKLKEALQGLDIIKLKQSDVIKIIDILPENAVELNKIFTEVALDADETNKILDTIKNNK